MFTFSSIFIGLRYIKSKRRHQFISFIAGFSLIGMALGTLALIVVLSVMNGFNKEITERILRVVPHGFVDKAGGLDDWQSLANKLEDFPHVEATAPYIGGYSMLTSRQGIQSAQIQGVLPEFEKNVSAIADYTHVGTMEDLHAGEFGVVLGNLLARFLRVDVGDKVLMTLPDVVITPAGIFPRVKRFTVVGVFEAGAQVDQSLALIHLEDAQKLFRYGKSVQGLRAQLDDIFIARDAMQNIKQALGEQYQVKDWSQTQGNLFQAIKMEKRLIALLLMIVVAVAALNIITGLVLMVADKRGDIAVLRTLGMKSRGVMGIFITQGAITGLTGILIGAIAGCVLAIYMSDFIQWLESVLGFYIFDPGVYFISEVPSELKFSDVVIICLSGAAMSILAAIYPAYCAAQVEPAEVLRYE